MKSSRVLPIKCCFEGTFFYIEDIEKHSLFQVAYIRRLVRMFMFFFSSILSQFNGEIDKNVKSQNDIHALCAGWPTINIRPVSNKIQKYIFFSEPRLFFYYMFGTAKKNRNCQTNFSNIFNIIFANDITDRIGWI